jgi:hypothetical protein
MYDPSVGRWTSEDPIRYKAGDTNVSRYAGNNAANAVDPSGLEVLNWKNKYPGIPIVCPHPKAGINDVIGDYFDAVGNKIELFANETSFYGKITLSKMKPFGFGRCIADHGVNVWLVERDAKGEFKTIVWVNIAPSSEKNKATLTGIVAAKLLQMRNAKKPRSTTIAEDMAAVAEALKEAEAKELLKAPAKTKAGDARFEVVQYVYSVKLKTGTAFRLYGTGQGKGVKSEWRRDPELGLDGNKIPPK